MIEKNDKLSDEKKTLKRNLHEKEQEATQQNKIITSLELAKKNLTKKVEELEFSLKEKNAAHKVLQKEFDSLNKTNESLKKA